MYVVQVCQGADISCPACLNSGTPGAGVYEHADEQESFCIGAPDIYCDQGVTLRNASSTTVPITGSSAGCCSSGWRLGYRVCIRNTTVDASASGTSKPLASISTICCIVMLNISTNRLASI